MKKKFMTVNFAFTTGDVTFNHSRMISIKYDPKSNPTQEDFTEFAYHKAKGWFSKQYPESTLMHVICEPAIEGTLDEVTVTRGYKRSTSLKNLIPVSTPEPKDFGWFGNDVKPNPDGEDTNGEEREISDLVLIDIDGKRETFVTGKYFYPFEDKAGWWSVDEHYADALDEDNLKWQYLPLAKYETTVSKSLNAVELFKGRLVEEILKRKEANINDKNVNIYKDVAYTDCLDLIDIVK